MFEAFFSQGMTSYMTLHVTYKQPVYVPASIGGGGGIKERETSPVFKCSCSVIKKNENAKSPTYIRVDN